MDTDVHSLRTCAALPLRIVHGAGSRGTLALGFQVSLRILKPSCAINIGQVPPNEKYPRLGKLISKLLCFFCNCKRSG